MTDEQDLEPAFRRAGITPPPGRMPGLLATYADLKTMLPLLRRPGRGGDAEPAGTYVIETTMRETGTR